MSLQTVVIGGGSGFIGRAIASKLEALGYDILTISRQPFLYAMSWNDLRHQGLPKSTVAVINVAGQNVFDPGRRWTPGYQQNVYASRVHTTRLLAEEIQKMKEPPAVFGVISGVGYYKPSDTETYTEDSPGGDFDFFSKLCSEWEAASVLPDSVNTRRFVIRSGIVLGREGGIISNTYWPFWLGMGGPIASGKQPFPWIHIEDISSLFVHGIRCKDVHGILNGVSPQLVTNREFTKAFAKAMWRPALFPLPEFFLNLAFGKERGIMMTQGQKVLPKRTLESGFQFKLPDIHEACKECAYMLTN